MDRLTERDADRNVNIPIESDPEGAYSIIEVSNEKMLQVADRLAAYEDTGLEPQGITYQTAQLQEWQKKCGLLYQKNVELREKQIPKKPVCKSRGFSTEWYGTCKCGKQLYSSYKYCPECGQKLNWDKEWNRRDDGWIPVGKRLPEEGETILVWHKDGYIMLLVNMFDEMEDVTHWRPLPAGPENGLEGN